MFYRIQRGMKIIRKNFTIGYFSLARFVDREWPRSRGITTERRRGLDVGQFMVQTSLGLQVYFASRLDSSIFSP